MQISHMLIAHQLDRLTRNQNLTPLQLRGTTDAK